MYVEQNLRYFLFLDIILPSKSTFHLWEFFSQHRIIFIFLPFLSPQPSPIESVRDKWEYEADDWFPFLELCRAEALLQSKCYHYVLQPWPQMGPVLKGGISEVDLPCFSGNVRTHFWFLCQIMSPEALDWKTSTPGTWRIKTKMGNWKLIKIICIKYTSNF